MSDMPISSYVLQTEGTGKEAALEALAGLPWLTIGEPAPNGIPVVVESASEHEAKARGDELAQLPGISNAVLVYHNFEDLHECE